VTLAAEQQVIRPTFAQYKVLIELCKDGASNRIISRRLYCSEETIKCHIRRLLLMTGLGNRTELVAAVWSQRVIVEKPAEMRF
jgi:DNA-binding NarL/FixJ family response regulator